MTASEWWELAIRADSYLSLLWHRYVPADRKSDIELRYQVERTIADLRQAAKDLSRDAEPERPEAPAP